VLFADLVGSTALADGEDPERTRALLSRFYDAMSEEISARGGTVDKFIGDAVMAVFGAPTAQEDHAERALHAALGMRERLADLSKGALSLRIGVNSGEVVVGHVRESSSFVTGDAVNIAARLEQGAEPGDILVGERTAAAAAGAFTFDERVTIAAKGKATGIPARRLVRALAETRPRGVGGLRRTFVGRERELVALEAAYGRTMDEGRSQLVTLLGDPGIGKTTLIRTFRHWLGGCSPEPILRVGHCRSAGQATTCEALGEIIREHFGLLGSDSAETVRDRLGEREILGLMLGLEAPQDIHPLAVQDRLRQSWVGFLDELLADRPAVLMIEDLHWADDTLLNLLDDAVHEVWGPLLLLATARPEFVHRRPGWGTRGQAQTLRLEPLSARDAKGMLERLVPVELPGAVRELVLERAEGNPFFVEELLRSLIDQGVIGLTSGDPPAPSPSRGLVVPDSVHAVLAARIDLLDAPEKTALQAAAVIGRTFWSGPVYELLEGLAPDLRILEQRGFVVRRQRSSMAQELELVFAHALIREVAYGSVPKAARARLHAGFAAWLERVGGARDEDASLLAHHYAEAVRPADADLAWGDRPHELARLRERAVSWLRAAATLAVGRYEIEDARTLLRQAVALEERPPIQAEIWAEIAHASALYFDGAAFSEAMQRAIRLADDPATTGELHAELAFQTMIRAGMWGVAPETGLVHGWVERALDLAPPHGSARAKALIARCYSDYDKSAAMVDEAAAIAEGLDDPALRSYCCDLRGLRELAAGDAEASVRWHRRRVALVDELDDPDHRADIFASAIIPAVAIGSFDEARAYTDAHEEATRALSPHHRLHGVSAVLELEELLGDWEAARRLQPRIEEAVAANLATPCARNKRSLLVCALARAQLGEEDEARRLERAAAEHEMSGFGTAVDAPRLQLALKRNDLVAAASLLDEPGVRRTNWLYLSAVAARLDGLAALRERSVIEAEAPALLRAGTYLEPFALRALGLVREDDNLIARAAERFVALGLPWHAATTGAPS
jgi:class 3 adenylate cyclase